jgi:hypothetical protein
MLLVNEPIPVPSDVFVVSAIVGSAVVLQQTPLALTELPPSEVIFPPLVAVDPVMAVTAVVVIVGKTPVVENKISVP